MASQAGQASARVNLLGNLSKSADGTRVCSFNVAVPTTVRMIIEELEKRQDLQVHRESTLILVNGVEVGALEDLETKIEAADDVVLVPMFHGGL